MKAKSPEERKKFVRQARLCENCFRSGHMAMDCRSRMKCQVIGCGWKHHTLLHVKKKNNNNSIPPNNPEVASEETGTSTVSGAGETGQCGATGVGKKNFYLRIVSVVVRG